MQTLSINGKEYQVDVPDDMPLLWVLRDIVGLTGTKFGCGVAQCGACSIMIDGTVVRSCSTPVSLAKGRQVFTIEGSSTSLTYLGQAWKELSVPQCGYCQSGQLISAAALLDAKETPTDDDIDEAMNGNICRCGTYVRIKEAIHMAAKRKKEAI
ncbi:(2Fe-2S)-binding protein [Pseudotenacibaculum haliotis]|uniref:(2Fe-2S)-binding protein n=1 Tax=Pseudotenacibaculum haliotis TaxID=1862138 RepID=A0ABW5LMY0_9FLAO